MAKQKENEPEMETQNVTENPAQTPVENVPEKKQLKEVVVISSAEYWDFEKNHEFIGTYGGIVRSEKAEDNGKIIGFNFLDVDGDIHIIGNSSAIEKGLDTMLPSGKTLRESGHIIRILYIGQITLQNGKPYNRFKVSYFVED